MLIQFPGNRPTARGAGPTAAAPSWAAAHEAAVHQPVFRGAGPSAAAPSWAAAHEAAVARRDNFYTDAASGLMVMTRLAHESRGRCCGSGCRHCPYAHERVPAARRAAAIANPAWLAAPEKGAFSGAARVTVLFWSTGKDSFLALRALRRAAQGPIVLLTTFDAQSRRIAHQETHIGDAVAQAAALAAPLLGVPLHRGGPEYSAVIRAAVAVVRAAAPPGAAVTLAFGDLHLAHVRQWREAAALDGDALVFPLWNVPYETLLDDLEASGAAATVSAVAAGGRGEGVVATGDRFDRALAARLAKAGVDPFGEEGEFHTLVTVAPAAAEA